MSFTEVRTSKPNDWHSFTTLSFTNPKYLKMKSTSRVELMLSTMKVFFRFGWSPYFSIRMPAE